MISFAVTTGDAGAGDVDRAKVAASVEVWCSEEDEVCSPSLSVSVSERMNFASISAAGEFRVFSLSKDGEAGRTVQGSSVGVSRAPSMEGDAGHTDLASAPGVLHIVPTDGDEERSLPTEEGVAGRGITDDGVAGRRVLVVC